MTVESALSESADRCYRCDYDLRGIADDQPCPECGLLALRSRRETDELHNTRPKWLWRISRGIWMILLAIFVALIWPSIADRIYSMVVDHIVLQRVVMPPAGFRLAPATFPAARPQPFVFVPAPRWLILLLNILRLFGEDMAAAVLLAGAILLTWREGYAPADDVDKRLRLWLRLAAAVPLFDLIALHGIELWSNQWIGAQIMLSRWLWPLFGLLTAVPLPLLLFLQLRGLAKRARSAHLAEHCGIVGIGASAALLYTTCLVLLSDYAEQLGLGQYWFGRSKIALFIVVSASTAGLLFLLWALYLLIRFAIAFHIAAGQLQRKWVRDDRSTAAA